MKAIVNGKILEEANASIPISDRGFLYGDGLFETILVYNEKPFQWQEHWQRLKEGASSLRFKLPFTETTAKKLSSDLLKANSIQTGVLRLMVTRGCGPRGYSTKNVSAPNWVITTSQLSTTKPGSPLSWDLHVTNIRLQSRDPLALCKHNNKLRHILGRKEAEENKADEALFLNEKSEVAECSSGNIFWINNNALCTPPLRCGVLAGISRETVLILARTSLGMDVCEAEITVQDLCKQDAVFITLSTYGVIQISRIGSTNLSRSPMVKKIHKLYWEKVQSETL